MKTTITAKTYFWLAVALVVVCILSLASFFLGVAIPHPQSFLERVLTAGYTFFDESSAFLNLLLFLPFSYTVAGFVLLRAFNFEVANRKVVKRGICVIGSYVVLIIAWFILAIAKTNFIIDDTAPTPVDPEIFND